MQICKASRQLVISTWNVAAINNNPFEYWLTMDENPEYLDLMNKVENFIENPGELDVFVSSVFTEKMFEKLENRFEKIGWDSVRSYWNNDYRNRQIVSGFLKDPLLGSKRLASMPDRVTNTINVAESEIPACRPTVISMYENDLSSLEKWFDAWQSFMFDKPLKLPPTGLQKIPYQMLLPIKKAKYPDISEEEEKVSLPLQTLCGAIFDAILVHMMNTVSKPAVWQPLKRQIVESLNKKKVSKTLSILEKTYISNDVITLQEVSVAMIELAFTKLSDKFHIIAPQDMDSARDQNSVILLNKETFPHGVLNEVTFSNKIDKVSNGDLLVVVTIDKFEVPYVIASFHGDTNGLSTIPVLETLIETVLRDYKTHKFIFGLDANSYEKAKPLKKLNVLQFGEVYVSHGFTSCWGDVPDPKNYTTYNARTYLQPQLNKACKSHDKRSCGDVNLKDFILFSSNEFKVIKTWKDNTGNNEYKEDMAFPTLNFPSDHGIVSTIIQPINKLEIK